MIEVVLFSVFSEVSLCFFCYDDIDIVKYLCGDWFFIEYLDLWYCDIIFNKKFFFFVVIYRGVIVGMIVVEIKNRIKIYKEDGDILVFSFFVDI